MKNFPSAPRGLSLDTTPPKAYDPDPKTLGPKPSLTEIADLYGTDKGRIFHNYTGIYERYLAALRSQPIRLAELGVACGASLKMWATYFKLGTIIGYDIRTEVLNVCKGWSRIHIEIRNPVAERIDTPVDIFIDDGSHVSADIKDCLLNNWPMVKPGGYYIIEDLACTYTEDYRANFTFPMDPERFNRIHFLSAVDAVLRDMDKSGHSTVEFAHFYPELMVIKKAD